MAINFEFGEHEVGASSHDLVVFLEVGTSSIIVCCNNQWISDNIFLALNQVIRSWIKVFQDYLF